MKRIFRNIASSLLAALLLCAMPCYALASQPDSSSSATTKQDGVLVSAEGEAAYMEGSSFALSDFTRFEKGSNQERGGKDIGYNYYEGSSSDYVAAILIGNEVLVYIPNSAHSLCDVADETSKEQLRAYLCALDDANNKGGFVLSQDMQWTFTSDVSQEFAGAEITFSLEAEQGKFYISLRSSTDLAVVPDHVDIGRIVAPDQADIVMPAQGIAALGEFLAGIDYSPLWVTLKTTGCAIVIIFVLGLAAAYFTMRISKRAQDIFDTIFTIPMVLPPTVCGFLLLLLLGRNTALGQWFIDIGFPLIFSWPATVIAASVVAFPLMYRSCRGAFENLDANMLDAARTLGWSNPKIFFKLIIPLSWSSIAAATVLSFARALGEFGATLFLAGNYVGITRTIPIAIYFEWMSGNTDVAIFWTIIILLFSFAVILFINLWSRHTTKYRKRGGGK